MFVQRKKVEIIIEVVKIPKIIRLIDALGISGYSLIHNVEGRGVHGMCDAQEVTDVLSNDYILIICSPEEAMRLLDEVAPILKKFGGICYVSDVSLLKLE